MEAGFTVFESRQESEYRQMFEAFYRGADVPADVRVLLIERQVALGLSPEQVQRIEAQVIERKIRARGATK